jgi:FkbM family methyltransferase
MSSRKPDKRESLRILQERKIPVGSVIDVGVCHGTPELIEVWPDKEHVLFEPVVEFAGPIESCYKSVSHQLYSVAVGEECGEIGLEVSAHLPGMQISHSKMTSIREHDQDPCRTVSKVSLDSFLPKLELEKPYLLKIDIDGLELKVLSGAKETLGDCSVLIIECQATQLAQIIKSVQSAGFTLFDLCEPCYYDKCFWQCDAIFVKSSLSKTVFKQLSGEVEQGVYEIYRA